MDKIYKFFGITPMGSLSDGLRFWKVRTRVSLKNDSHPKTYDRHDPVYGLHS